MDDLTAWTSDWPVGWASVGVTDASSTLGSGPDPDRPFRIASISKTMVGLAALVALEEESITLDEPAGPEGSTVRHLLAHASGLAFDDDRQVSPVGKRRVYSNVGIERFCDHLAERTGMAFERYLTEAVFEPLGLASTELRGSPAHAVFSTISDLLVYARELLQPTLVSAETLAMASRPHFPDLAGMLPGITSFDPNPFGLTFEIRGDKHPHWTAPSNSPATFGHFGGSGSFLWVDPTAGLAAVSLADQDFGAWSLEVWPAVNERMLEAYSGRQ
jgi:CubicO group peptidase (beta-lactamase class C family)